MLPDDPATTALAGTVAYPSWGGFAVGLDAGTVTDASVTTFIPSELVKTVPLGMGCGVKRPLYKVRLPVAGLASWWPLPVVGLVTALVRVTGASWRVCRGIVVVNSLESGYVLFVFGLAVRVRIPLPLFCALADRRDSLVLLPSVGVSAVQFYYTRWVFLVG